MAKTKNNKGSRAGGRASGGKKKTSRRTRLKIVIVITTIMFFAEIFFGYWTRSIALIADSFHMFSDVAALCIAHYAITLASRHKKPSDQYTFGWQRAETLGALINATFLLALCFSIIMQALQRFFQPEIINNPMIMFIVGCTGLVVNLFSMSLFHDHDHDHGTPGKLNMQGAFLHVMGDALGSVGVVASASIIQWTNWSLKIYVDPVASLFIAIIIIFTTWPLFRKTSYIVLHVVPSSISMEKLKREIMKISLIQDVHEFHVWQLSDMKTIASVHVILFPIDVRDRHHHRTYMDVSTAVKLIFHAHGIHNTTVQLEVHNGENRELIPVKTNGDDCLLSCNDEACSSANVTCCPVSDDASEAENDDECMNAV